MAVMMTNRLLALVIAVALSDALTARAAYASHLDLPAASEVPTIALRAAQALADRAQGVLDPRIGELRAARARQEAIARYHRDEHAPGGVPIAIQGNLPPVGPIAGVRPGSPAAAARRPAGSAERENERESGESRDGEAKGD